MLLGAPCRRGQGSKHEHPSSSECTRCPAAAPPAFPWFISPARWCCPHDAHLLQSLLKLLGAPCRCGQGSKQEQPSSSVCTRCADGSRRWPSTARPAVPFSSLSASAVAALLPAMGAEPGSQVAHCTALPYCISLCPRSIEVHVGPAHHPPGLVLSHPEIPPIMQLTSIALKPKAAPACPTTLAAKATCSAGDGPSPRGGSAHRRAASAFFLPALHPLAQRPRPLGAGTGTLQLLPLPARSRPYPRLRPPIA